MEDFLKNLTDRKKWEIFLMEVPTLSGYIVYKMYSTLFLERCKLKLAFIFR